jgi:hypothetical protein
MSEIDERARRAAKLADEAATAAQAGNVGDATEPERLTYVGLIRDGITYGGGFDSHYSLRASLGDPSPNVSRLYDEEGFFTSHGRFVDRETARGIALAAGQIGEQWREAGRRLLSSDVDWNAGK